MKIGIYSDDVYLIDEFSKIADVEKVTDLNKVKSEILILSDRLISYTELSTLTINKETKSTFYMVSNNYTPGLLKQVKTICDGLGIHMISPRLTVKQIVDEVNRIVNPEKVDDESKIITFLSTIGNIGTTQTTLSTAKAIAYYTEARIGVVSLNVWDDGSDFIPYSGQYLDSIKTRLANQMYHIDNEEFYNVFHMVQKDSIYYLAGNRNTRLERLFTVKEIDYLLQTMKKAFDIVLVDAGHHFDNAAMVQALNQSDLKFMMTTQQKKAIKKFEQVYDDILYPLNYTRDQFLLIVNRYIDDSSLPSFKEIQSEYGIPSLTLIPDLNILGIQAEANKKILYDFEDEEYNDSINHIAKAIISRVGLDMKTDLNKKSRSKIFSWAKRRIG